MIFLDAAATTPVRREVIEAMFPFLTNQFGNPSSHHELGEAAAAALAAAREQCATALGAHPEVCATTTPFFRTYIAGRVRAPNASKDSLLGSL